MGNACQFDITNTDADTGLMFEASSSELAEKWMESFRCNKYCPFSPKTCEDFKQRENMSHKTLPDSC